MTNGDDKRRTAVRGRRGGGWRQRGFGYLMVLFAMAAMGIGLAGAGEVWHTTAVRERETQLLFVGDQFRQALASYRARSPQGAPTAPARLADLLQDPRFPMPVRHLRRVWPDPMTPDGEWALVKLDDRIIGVHSRSRGEPLRTAFEARDADFAGAGSYDKWVFTAAAVAAPVAAPAEGDTP